MVNRESLVETLLTSLANERAVDTEETAQLLSTLSPRKLEAKGLAVLNLVVGSMRTGLGGKTILELEPDTAIYNDENHKIDVGSIRVGDNVKIESQPAVSKVGKSKDKGEYLEGVVTKTAARSIAVAIDDKFESNSIDGRVWIAQLSNPVTYKRMEYAVNDMLKTQRLSPLHQLLLGDRDPSIVSGYLRDDQFLDTSLNSPQREAVSIALANELTIIHGPPGTGKTYTLVEVIRHLVGRGERVLVCGPSNISVDNILERLHGHIKGNQLLRLGHPARLLQSNLIHSLDIVSKTSDRGLIIRDIRQEIDHNLGKVKKARYGRERRELFGEIKELRKEYRTREKSVLTSLILEASVVVATLHGAGSRSLKEAIASVPGKPLFDTIIIDEVSQSLEAQCWIPLMMAPNAGRLIIAGDNQQLPPTVKTKNGKHKRSLETTIFDRLVAIHGDKIKKLLSIQYRMNTNIMDFPSRYFYQGKLQADKSVADGVLSDLPGVSRSDLTESKVVWLDTQGGDFPEHVPLEDVTNLSRLNENEAHLAFNYVKSLMDAGVQQGDIGIIAPYSAQVGILKRLLEGHPDIEVSTVDGFQGREKEVIVMTLVRSNEKKEIGFLSEDRRINVAITRPRRHLCIIGDIETVGGGKSKFLQSWTNWAEENADLEYPNVGEL
jgi:DNA polymerase alpha-associated DNA helicase A